MTDNFLPDPRDLPSLASFGVVSWRQRRDRSTESASDGCNALFGVDLVGLGRDFDFIQAIFEEDRELFESTLEAHSRDTAAYPLVYRIDSDTPGAAKYVCDVRRNVYGKDGTVVGYEGLWIDVTQQALVDQYLVGATSKYAQAMVTEALMHDFSNHMTGIYTLSECCRDSLDADSALRQDLDMIVDSAVRAQQIVRQLSDFNRDESETCAMVTANLARFINDQMPLLRVIFPKGTKILMEGRGDQWTVKIDPQAFRRMLIQLAFNARDALGESGQIEISLRSAPVETGCYDDVFPDLVATDNAYVEMVFKDNGRGVSADSLQLIFKPYYTTQSKNNGLGLGLHLADRCMACHNGFIGARSVLGQGTEIIMLLSLVAGK